MYIYGVDPLNTQIQKIFGTYGAKLVSNYEF